MSSTFTPSQSIDMSKEKDWPMHLGMLDWDTTKIIFTKRSLVEFLKYAGVTIDPGFTNVQKLPRYAQFGNMVAGSGSEETTTTKGTASTASTAAESGAQELFEEEFPDDALANAPPPPLSTHHADNATATGATTLSATARDTTDNPQTGPFKPTRRVRTIPGGTDSIGNIFSDETEQFVPTRRVRQRPGGKDSIEGLF